MMKKDTGALLCVLALAGAGGCDNDPGEGKPKAEVGEAVPEPQEAPNGPGTAKDAVDEQRQDEADAVYIFDNSTSDLEFVGAKVTNKHEGEFKKFAGEITLPEATERGAVEVTVQTESVEADDPKLTKHLKSSDFFDVEKYPEAKFVSTSVAEQPGEAGATHAITGNLTLHGVTKSITFPAKIVRGPSGVEVDSAFVINRKDFEIIYPGLPDDMIKDEVALTLRIRAAPRDE